MYENLLNLNDIGLENEVVSNSEVLRNNAMLLRGAIEDEFKAIQRVSTELDSIQESYDLLNRAGLENNTSVISSYLKLRYSVFGVDVDEYSLESALSSGMGLEGISDVFKKIKDWLKGKWDKLKSKIKDLFDLERRLVKDELSELAKLKTKIESGKVNVQSKTFKEKMFALNINNKPLDSKKIADGIKMVDKQCKLLEGFNRPFEEALNTLFKNLSKMCKDSAAGKFDQDKEDPLEDAMKLLHDALFKYFGKYCNKKGKDGKTTIYYNNGDILGNLRLAIYEYSKTDALLTFTEGYTPESIEYTTPPTKEDALKLVDVMVGALEDNYKYLTGAEHAALDIAGDKYKDVFLDVFQQFNERSVKVICDMVYSFERTHWITTCDASHHLSGVSMELRHYLQY